MVYDMVEDASGFMWFATDKGVVRYDGSNIVPVDTKDETFTRGVFRMFKAKDNSLWFITTDFQLYSYRNKTFVKIEVGENVAWIAEDGKQRLTAMSRQGNLYTIGKNNQVTTVNRRLYSDKFRSYMFCSIDSNQLMLSRGNGVFISNSTTGLMYKIVGSDHTHSFDLPRVFKIYGRRFLFATHLGLFSLVLDKENSWKVKQLLNNRFGEIISVCEDNVTKDLWVGSSKGLLKIVAGKIEPEVYLSGTNCFNVHKTSEDLLWCTSAESGVFFTNMRSFHFNKEEGLLNEKVKFLQNIGDTIYTFGLNGNAWLFHKNKIVSSLKLNTIYDVPAFRNVAKAGDSIYAWAYPDKFVKIFNGRMGRMVIPDSMSAIFGFKQFYYVDRNKIRRGPKQTLIYETKHTSNLGDIMHNNVVNHIPLLIPNDTTYYYATKDGYGILKGQKMTLNKLGARVMSIVVTPRRNLVFNTQGKGVYIKRKNKKPYFLTEDQGLLSNYSSKLLLKGNSLWVLTNKGVSRLTLNGDDSVVRIANFTMNDVLNISEVNDLLIHDSSVYVASNKGITVFPEEYTISKELPKVFIENIQINNRDTTVQDSFILSYQQNNIAITYTSPTIRNAKSVLFKYAIVGKESRVTTGVSKSKNLQLGALSPDEYVVKIWARNNDGLWSDQPARLFIKVLPPFWKAGWFIWSVILFLLIVISLIVIIRLRQIRERAKIDAQLLDSELKALRLHMNPHFIFNTLNSLQKFILQRNPLEANKFISKFAKLMRWILSYADKQYITLEAELLFLDTYIELEQLRFDSEIKVVKEVDDKLFDSGFLIPALVVQPFVENAIKYGIAGINYQGELLLRFEQYPDYIRVTIQDNGVGRAAVKREQDFSGKEFESTGVKYTNERLLLLLENRLNITDAVIITDLYDETGVASGTRVELIIPYYNE